ncbi:MAG TPA: alpha/beta hydrolase-fold protein [Solirubrobacteraceae bacterium]|nr:alpha/beta hydrolase-fold protein [Solirubrobacteraceae bacterium]
MRRRGLEATILLVVVAVVAGVALSAGATPHRHPGGQRRVAERTRQVTPQPPMPPTTRGPGRLFTVYFYSAALHRRADYLVYLPAGYTPSRRLPVFYLLHGMPGRPMAFTLNAHTESKLEELIRLHEVRPMILVFPDGRIGGRTATDSEWANTRAGRFESYVVDVVHNVDQRFATLADRRHRAIAGLSAGAYGAANVGLHQVALFGLIQVWSGYFLQTPTGVFARATPAQLSANSPLEYAYAMGPTLKRYPLRIFIYTGTHDSDRFQTPPMAAALRAVGAHVGSAIYRGGHSWNLWSPRVDQMLIMASRFFSSP